MAYRFIVPAIVSLMAGYLANGQALGAETACGARAIDIVRSIFPDISLSGETITTSDEKTIALPDERSIGDDPYAMVCRQWPAHPDLLLVALPLIAERSDDGTEGDLGLYILAGDTLNVLARTTLENMMVEDAIRIDAVDFDTAHYRLAPDRIAFGLRMSQRGSSRVNPFAITTLWLFDHREGQISTVLDNIVVKASGGEWDGVCNGDFWSASSLLAMTDEVENGVYGIRVSSRDEVMASELRNGECETVKTSIIQTSETLLFNGTAYEVPETLARGW